MRICLLSNSSFARNPRALAEAESTRWSGHDVVGVSPDATDESWVRSPSPTRPIDRLRRIGREDQLLRTAVSQSAQLFVPVHPDAIQLARRAAGATGATYLTRPEWNQNDEADLKWRAPGEPALATPAFGLVPRLHTPGPNPRGDLPTGPVVIVYRRTERNPGRYLESALRRSGIETQWADALDWHIIPNDTSFVVIVESPLPALRVRGVNPGIPVIFWVHHGEHHLNANTRLQERYGADSIALAHSWHLAYRFRGLVERLPFAVAPELVDSTFRPHRLRSHDVAFVGSRSHGSRYARRQELLDRVRSAIGPGGVAEADDLTPEAMMSLYRDSRLVPDDGWGRHLPVTMRVFEATGAGAALATHVSPGLEILLDEGAFISLRPDEPDQIVELTKSASLEATASRAHAAVWADHTYDSRVLDLAHIAERARDVDIDVTPTSEPVGGLARAVVRFPDAQRVLDLEAGVAAELGDREVWSASSVSSRDVSSSFHVSVIAGGSKTDREQAVAAARIAVVVPRGLADEIGPVVTSVHGDFSTDRLNDDVVIFGFGSSGYRVSPQPDPD